MRRWLNLGFADRILPFDSSAARAYALIASGRRHAGRPSERPTARSPPYPARTVLYW